MQTTPEWLRWNDLSSVVPYLFIDPLVGPGRSSASPLKKHADAPVPVLLTDDSGWVANALGGTLTKLNRESEQLGVFSVGEEPNAMVFDGEFNWTTNRNEASVNKVGLDGTLLGAF